VPLAAAVKVTEAPSPPSGSPACVVIVGATVAALTMSAAVSDVVLPAEFETVA